MAIKGYGNLVMFDEEGKLYIDRLSEIQFGQDVQARDVLGYPYDNPDGLLQVVDSFRTSETFSCQVTTGSFDKLAIARLFNQQIKKESISFPHSEKLKIGVTATPEIAIASLVANQQVGVFLPSDKNPIQFTQTTSAPTTADTFQVTAGKIIFAASNAEKTVIVNYFKGYTDIETIGVSNNPIGDLAFTGRLIGPRFDVGPQFYIPRLVQNSGFSFGGENSQVTFRATVKEPFARPIVFAYDIPLSA